MNSEQHALPATTQAQQEIPVSLPGLNLDGAHIPASVSHLAAHAQMQQQMQAQAQQQLHQQQQQQPQQQQQSHHQMPNHQNAQNNGPTAHSQNAQRDDNKVKDEGGSCTTERCSDNQVHCQVQCDLQLQPPQDLQQSLMQQQQQQQQQQHSKSYTVENLASSNYTPSMNHGHPGNSYPNIIPGHYPVPMGSTNGYLFGGLESSLMQRTYAGIGGMSGMSSMHPSAALGHPMAANPYPYNGSYSSSFDAYPAPPAGIHAPSANYPGYVGTAGATSGTATTPPSYLAPSHHRPPVDLSYDGV